MRLTNGIKNQIANSVMADTKSIDYLGQAITLVTKRVMASAPKVIRDAYAFDPTVFQHYSAYNEAGVSVKYPALFDGANKVAAHDKDVTALVKKHLAQKSVQKEARSALESLLAGCTTSDTLLAVAPELEKYIPTDTPKKCLPVATGLKDKLKAAGWPKGGRK